ncbi:hypothetical protein [Natrialbaceae archaeon AArc-T1-2]|uniref:hypothetical protein n=1 Tax=Natrialbaceae archaeon AArc-T1-2 TaxID=3053904 RepID=UPI00255A7A4A|nr:hypothetical protein [Natrialbaceae archaeon AArc-T1-2]WIV66258.1 hypothetical protein QQ977_11210 [Natrialbaceae archaeon AArc-T1-2]
MIEDLLEALFSLESLIAAFGGGAFGAAIGALPAFIFTGFLVIVGEAAVLVDPGATAITDDVAFGPAFSPAVSFGGGAAATAYAARQGYLNTGFRYHEAKNVTRALGTKPDVLAVGGAFGVLGFWLTELSVTLGMPYDPIAMGVVLSALFHRLILRYSLVGRVRGNVLDMSPFERGERREPAPDGGQATAERIEHESGVRSRIRARLVVEPWLPHQYRWGHVATTGLVAGILGAYVAVVTGSAFLAFGISAATLLFLNCGVENVPVTHHVTLPASTAALAVALGPDEIEDAPVPYNDAAVLAGSGSLEVALLVGAAVGIASALFGELFQRVFYAHGETHVDPPAAGIVFGTALVVALYLVTVLPTTVWVPFF